MSLAFNPSTFKIIPPASDVKIQATDIPTGTSRPIQYEPAIGWHRINLDGIKPIVPGSSGAKTDSSDVDHRNDAMERIKLVLSNPTDQEQIARMMFDKTSGGFRDRVGFAITGVSAILRDTRGHPTGIPVQLSKNWHTDAEAGTYVGPRFHGISQVRLPPGADIELELSIVNAHWGGVAAASHAQLSLIGWGINRLEPGDFVEATIQHIVMPQFARDYYGPNEDLRRALGQHENTWRMIHRESLHGDRKVQASVGKVQCTFPDVRVETTNDEAKLTLSGGLGYVPITFAGLSLPSGYVLVVNGQPIDQSVHGNDFWQTEYDPSTKRWSQTYNLPAAIDGPQSIHFRPNNETDP